MPSTNECRLGVQGFLDRVKVANTAGKLELTRLGLGAGISWIFAPFMAVSGSRQSGSYWEVENPEGIAWKLSAIEYLLWQLDPA